MKKLTLISFTTIFTMAQSSENLIDINIDLLKKALSIPSGGSNGKSYYNITINGEKIGGERAWENRWNLIKDSLNFKNKKILELGCNIGMSSMYILKFRRAKSSVGVDLPNEQLAKVGNPRMIEAAHLLQQAFNIPMEIKQLDFNIDNYEQIIGNNYDIVLCTSILKWVNDKQRFLKFLSNFKYVIFEGHDDDKTEIERFNSVGFKYYKILGSTQIGASYTQDQHRTLICFSKTPLFFIW